MNQENIEDPILTVGHHLLKGGTAILATLSHELTHQIRVQSPVLYAELQKAVLEELNGNNAEALQKMVNDALSKDSTLTAEDALEEVVANACEDMLRNDAALRSLLESHKTLGEKIKSFVKDFLNDIKNLLKDLSSNQEISEESALLRSSQDAYNRIAELWAKGLLNASEAGQYKKDFLSRSENSSKDKKKSRKSFQPQQEEAILKEYGIVKLNDYLHVQKCIRNKLPDSFFKSVTNKSSGMIVNITKKGINETFNKENFEKIPRFFKIAKILTIKNIHTAIENGIVAQDFVQNKHNANSPVKYAYVLFETEIEGIPVLLKIDVRKSNQSKTNRFHVHSIVINEKTDSPADYTYTGENAAYMTTSNDSIPQNSENVNPSSENSFAESFDTDVKHRARDSAESLVEPITSDDILSLRKIGRKSVNEFTSEDLQSSKKWAQKFYKELGVKSPFFRAWYGDWRAYDITPISAVMVDTVELDIDQIRSERGTFSNGDTGWNIVSGSLGEGETRRYSRGDKDSVKMLTALQKILNSAVLLDTEVSVKDSSKKHIDTVFMHKLFAPVEHNGKNYIARINVEEYFDRGSTSKRFYHLEGIKIEPTAKRFAGKTSLSHRAAVGSVYSIADFFDFVKRFDSNFKPIPVNKELLNADGTPKKFYHGAKNGGGFSEFRDWSYFTENRTYAERYTQRDNENSLYQTYIKMDKPFDTRKSECRKVFETMRQEYGLSELQDTGLPDWTDGYDIAEFIEENDLDYDGIILDEGGDLIDGKPVSRGFSYVVRDSTQIKSVDNVGTFDKLDPNIKRRARDTFDEISAYRSVLSELEAKAKTTEDRKQVSEWKKSVDAWEDLQMRQAEVETALKRKIPDVWESYQAKQKSLALEKQYQRTLKAEIEAENAEKTEGYRDRIKNLMQAREESFAKSKRLSAEILQLQEQNPDISEYEALEKGVKKVKASLSTLRKTDPVGAIQAQAKVEQRLEEQKARYQESVNRRNDRRKLAEIMGDTSKVRDRLVSMAKTPMASSYIPKEMVDAVVSIVNRVDRISVALRSEKVRQREREVESARKNLASAVSSEFEWEITPAERKFNEAASRLRNAEHYLDTLNNEIRDLETILNDLRKTSGSETHAAFEMAAERLSVLTSELKETPVSQLSRKQAMALNQAVRLVERAVKDANRVTVKGKAKDLSRTRKKLRDELADQTVKSKPFRWLGNTALHYATPLTFFEEMGGYAKDSEWGGVYNILNNAQTAYQDYAMRSSQMFDGVLFDEKGKTRKDYKALHDRKNLIDVGLRDESGKSVKVSRDMMLALYLSSFSEDTVGLLGLFLNIWVSGWKISPEILLGGLFSGLASTGLYEMFEKSIIGIFDTIKNLFHSGTRKNE